MLLQFQASYNFISRGQNHEPAPITSHLDVASFVFRECNTNHSGDLDTQSLVKESDGWFGWHMLTTRQERVVRMNNIMVSVVNTHQSSYYCASYNGVEGFN